MDKDYKRFTTRNEKGEWTIELNEELKWAQRDMSTDDFISSLFDLTAQRLCDLEDKIENGTLVEFPRIIHPNRMEWFVQYQYPNGVVQYYICFSEAEAEAKLKELKGERE